MKRSFFYVFSFILLLTYISNGFSQNRAFRSAQGGRWGGYAANVNLTSVQISKLDSLQSKFFKETLMLRNEIQTKSLELHLSMDQPSVDESKIITKQKSIFALQQKLQEKSLNYRLSTRSILTAEQISMLSPGCSLGFALGNGYGRGMGNGASFRHGKGNGRGMGNGVGVGRGRGIGNRFGSCPFGWR